MAGLMDFLQAASNTAASNVSGPVDGLSWLLKKAGVPVGNTPMLGSAWMEQQGLTKPVPQSAASLAGETASLLAPIGIAAKAPQIAAWRNAVNEALESGAGRMPRGAAPRGAVVWHGSPHKFDKFDSTKIGTGEGAQAYAHGLYLADAKDVASGYSMLTHDPVFEIAGKTWRAGPGGAIRNDVGLTSGTLPRAQQLAVRGLSGSKADKPLAVLAEEAESLLQTRAGLKAADIAAAKQAILDGQVKLTGSAGNLYKVDLPDEQIAKMLDWDKPLSQQSPAARDAINRVGRSAEQYGMDRVSDDMRMVELKRILQSKEGVEALRKAGIPGVRYLDGGSRAAGQGTSNYVVFPGNEGLLSILERNGSPLK